MSKKAEWFKKGQMSVLRKNKSGCCCIIDDNGNIVSVCDAHQAWLEAHFDAAQPAVEVDAEKQPCPYFEPEYFCKLEAGIKP